jgi:arylsulfatase A-like enzyme
MTIRQTMQKGISKLRCINLSESRGRCLRSLSWLLLALALPVTANERPNIVFIMVDDMGYADLGVTGSRADNTPNIDQLAAEGVLLTQGYSSAAICSPSRTALFTGRYPYRLPLGLHEPLGPDAPRDSGIPENMPTLASEFQRLDYETYLVGKWHLGNPPGNGPLQRGYDHFYGILLGGSDYFMHRIDLDDDVPVDGLFRQGERVEEAGYMTDLLADEVVRIIHDADAAQPFFVSLHFNAPHWPWEGPEDEAVSRALTSIFHWDGGSLETYAAMMRSMDSGVGRILAVLEERGLTENTLVIFTSDNGAERYSDTWPFTGYKGGLLEGGIRVPIIARWPGQITPGSVSTQMMASMDFLPTLLGALGETPSARDLDGLNLWDVLIEASPVQERTLYWRHKRGAQAAVRQGDWKYYRRDDNEWLFNVSKNPHERAQLRDRYPEKLTELRALWLRWNEQMLPYPEDSFSERTADAFP